MISYKNGILKANLNRDRRDAYESKLIYDILFVINLFSLYVFAAVKLVSSCEAILLFLSSLYVTFSRDRKKFFIPYNTIWYAIVIAYCALSTLWSSYFFSNMLGSMMRMVVICIIITSMALYVDTQDDLRRLMDMFTVAVFMIVVYELSITPISEWTTGWLGGNVNGNNSNNVSYWTAVAGTMSFFRAYNDGKKKRYILWIVFLVFTLFSSSRKSAMIIVLMPILLIALSTYKKHYVLRLIAILIISALVFYIIFTNETLYIAIGKRLESLLGHYINGENSDSSIFLREYFIKIAKKLFVSSPLVGKGYGNFAVLIMDDQYYANNGIGQTYAHNNYWQILSELGIIGFILYYSMYVYIFIKLVKRVFVERDKLSFLYLSFMISAVFYEIGMVSINSKFCQIAYAFIFISTYAQDNKSKTINLGGISNGELQ